MLTCSNIDDKTVISSEIYVIFIDIRGSSEINNNEGKKKKFRIYSNFFKETLKILEVNGFGNIDIQGDGIYGVTEYKNNGESIFRAMEQLNEMSTEDINYTFSILLGNEEYACFGDVENESKEKQMVFFGGTVSDAKKWISFSTMNTKIILNESAYDELKKIDRFRKYDFKKKGNKVKKWKVYE